MSTDLLIINGPGVVARRGAAVLWAEATDLRKEGLLAAIVARLPEVAAAELSPGDFATWLIAELAGPRGTTVPALAFTVPDAGQVLAVVHGWGRVTAPGGTVTAPGTAHHIPGALPIAVGRADLAVVASGDSLLDLESGVVPGGAALLLARVAAASSATAPGSTPGLAPGGAPDGGASAVAEAFATGATPESPAPDAGTPTPRHSAPAPDHSPLAPIGAQVGAPMGAPMGSPIGAPVPGPAPAGPDPLRAPGALGAPGARGAGTPAGSPAPSFAPPGAPSPAPMTPSAPAPMAPTPTPGPAPSLAAVPGLAPTHDPGPPPPTPSLAPQGAAPGPAGPGFGPGPGPGLTPPSTPPGASAPADPTPVAPGGGEGIVISLQPGMTESDAAREPLPVAQPIPAAGGDGVAPPPEPPAPAGPRAAIVPGVRCSRQHFNNPGALYCRVCGISMLQQTHVQVQGERPPLGVLVCDDGSTYGLDGDYAIGSDPRGEPGVTSGLAQPLVLGDQGAGVAPTHVIIHLDGWEVLALNRSPGLPAAVLHRGDTQWTPLPPGQWARLAPGSYVGFAGRHVVFESNNRA